MKTMSKVGLAFAAWLLAHAGTAKHAAAQPAPPAVAAPIAGPGFVPGFVGEVPVNEILSGVAITAAGLGVALDPKFPQAHGSWGPDLRIPYSAGSDITSYVTGFGGPLVISLVSSAIETAALKDAGDPDYGRGFVPSGIDVEAIGAAELFTGILKARVGRCRPRDWDGKSCNLAGAHDDPDERYRAFPSGHTTAPAAQAGARLALAIRYDVSARLRRLRWITFALAEGNALLTAALRVGAGAHSPTDVLTAFALGNAVGAGIACLHPPWSSQTRGISLSPTGVAWSGTF